LLLMLFAWLFTIGHTRYYSITHKC